MLQCTFEELDLQRFVSSFPIVKVLFASCLNRTRYVVPVFLVRSCSNDYPVVVYLEADLVERADITLEAAVRRGKVVAKVSSLCPGQFMPMSMQQHRTLSPRRLSRRYQTRYPNLVALVLGSAVVRGLFLTNFGRRQS